MTHKKQGATTKRRPGRTARPKRSAPGGRPTISDAAIARLMAMSPERPHFTVGDVMHRLKREAPALPGDATPATSRTPR